VPQGKGKTIPSDIDALAKSFNTLEQSRAKRQARKKRSERDKKADD